MYSYLYEYMRREYYKNSPFLTKRRIFRDDVLAPKHGWREPKLHKKLNSQSVVQKVEPNR